MSKPVKPAAIWIAWVFLVAACLFGAVPDRALAEATTGDAIAGMSLEGFSDWMSFYYQSKQPQVLPAAIARASELGILAGKGLLPMVGFLAGTFSDNPDRIDATLKAAKALPTRDYQVVLTAAVLGTKPGSAQQNALSEQLDADGQWLLKALMARGIHAKSDVAPTSGEALDFLWGVFFATGDTKSVLPIIATIAKPEEPKEPTQEDIMTLAVHSAAAWSLGSNARQHPAIMELCKKEMKRQPPEIAGKLKEIVEGS
jgi:hypothetical protein